MTDEAYVLQAGNQKIAIACRQMPDDFESLFEHADKRVEVSLILKAEIVAESGSALTVEDH